jgi:hypothetical protein
MQFAVRVSIKTMGEVVAGREVINATISFQSKQRIRSSSVVKEMELREVQLLLLHLSQLLLLHLSQLLLLHLSQLHFLLKMLWLQYRQPRAVRLAKTFNRRTTD